jgi:hypothetical protein
MEDHEPSDLIPLFNGMNISFINYELQVRIEPKTSEELSHCKFENYPITEYSTPQPSVRSEAKLSTGRNKVESHRPAEEPHHHHEFEE